MTEEQITDLLQAGYGDADDRSRWPAAPPALGARLVRRVRRRRLLRGGTLSGVAALTAGAVLVPSLSGGGPAAPVALPPLTLTAATLTSYADCPAMLAGLVERATPQVGPYGYVTPGAVASSMGVPTASAPSASPPLLRAPAAAGPQQDAASASGAATAGSPYHSSTTNRTRGVDEPDTVKTDGRLVVSVTSSGWLHTTDPIAAAPLGALHLRAGGPLSLLLVGSRAVVLGGPVPGPVAPTGSRPTTGSLSVVDLADPRSPRVERTVSLSARVLSARLLGGTIRLVTAAAPPALRWQQPTDGSDAAAERARQANLGLLRAASADDWLPTYSVVGADGRATATGRLYECTAVEHPRDGEGADTTGVLSFDPASSAGPEGAAAVVGSGDTAYATGTHVWIATTRGLAVQPWGGVRRGRCCPPPWSPAEGQTQLHLFDVADAARTRYVASGEVDGTLLDQTALDEAADGTLRTVTSTAQPSAVVPASTSLTTLRVRPDATLAPVGRLAGLAPGEQVQAVRYVGDLAYVVTFRRTDPLTVLDLRDPSAPRLRGELRVPGYSALLAEAEPGHLLGVGMAGTDGGLLTGVGVGLFDVSDPDAPTRIDALALGAATGDVTSRTHASSTTSEALTDPHAFLYWRPARLAMLPLSSDGRPADLACVRVEPTRLVRVYTLRHDGRPGRGSSAVSRALVVGPRVLTVSDRGVLVSSLASGADQGWAPFTG